VERDSNDPTPTVLLVDDEEGIRRLLETILRPTGIHLLLAADGLEAWQLAQTYPGEIHLLFSDIMMPRMDGIELAARLSRERPRMGVILCSAHSSKQPPADSGWRFLGKPFYPQDVLAEVRQALAG
jgi:hypothetical protein